jgi:hypothetical protein
MSMDNRPSIDDQIGLGSHEVIGSQPIAGTISLAEDRLNLPASALRAEDNPKRVVCFVDEKGAPRTDVFYYPNSSVDNVGSEVIQRFFQRRDVDVVVDPATEDDEDGRDAWDGQIKIPFGPLNQAIMSGDLVVTIKEIVETEWTDDKGKVPTGKVEYLFDVEGFDEFYELEKRKLLEEGFGEEE